MRSQGLHVRYVHSFSYGMIDRLHLYNLGGHFVAGYHWFWPHFNLAIGAGADVNSAGDKKLTDPNGTQSQTVPIKSVTYSTEFSMGFAF